MKRVPMIDVFKNLEQYPEEIRDWNFWHEKAEKEFRTSPASAYRTLKSLWKENMDENAKLRAVLERIARMGDISPDCADVARLAIGVEGGYDAA